MDEGQLAAQDGIDSELRAGAVDQRRGFGMREGCPSRLGLAGGAVVGWCPCLLDFFDQAAEVPACADQVPVLHIVSKSNGSVHMQHEE